MFASCLFLAAVVICVAHFGTMLLSSLRTFDRGPMPASNQLTSYRRCFSADPDVDRDSVHRGTFVYVSILCVGK